MLTRKQKRPSPKSLVQMLRSTLGFPPTIIMMAQNHSGAIMNWVSLMMIRNRRFMLITPSLWEIMNLTNPSGPTYGLSPSTTQCWLSVAMKCSRPNPQSNSSSSSWTSPASSSWPGSLVTSPCLSATWVKIPTRIRKKLTIWTWRCLMRICPKIYRMRLELTS